MNIDLDLMEPAVYRSLLRKGKFKRKSTMFACKDYKQANLVILPEKFADDFELFSKGNSGPLPLLYKSKPGEFQAPLLCKDSDVRTDAPLYNRVVYGNIDASLDDLLEYDLSNYVSFYIGCSYSFDDILIFNEIMSNDDKPPSVSVFETNIKCYQTTHFNCNMMVSMRLINKEKLSLTASLCNFMHDVHGPPICYGNSESIGIIDITNPDYGDSVEKKNEEIPVFWCCGVTGMQALKSANIDLSFSHSPSCMFITDIKQQIDFSEANKKENKSEVIEYNSKCGLYSSLSTSTLNLLNNLYSVVQEDMAGRNIKGLIIQEDFVKAALALSHSSKIAMITGFPVRLQDNPPDETDGLPGVISLVAVLQSLGKKIALVVDEHALNLNVNIVNEMVKNGLIEDIEVLPYKNENMLLVDEGSSPVFDVILSSERVGRSVDGNYYSMRGNDVSSLVTPIDDFFIKGTKCPKVTTIAIGDGGNELGMGKVINRVQKHIPLGEKIACAVPSDLLITVGVSNWGCYALGLALYALQSCPIHDRYRRRAIGFPFKAYEIMKKCLPSVRRERRILQIVEEFGIKDGVKPNQSMSVDGLLFDKEHTKLIQELMKLVNLTEQ